MTAVASDGPRRPTSWPVSTRPVASSGRLTLVGRTVGSNIDMGAAELPPESEFSVPIRVTT